MENFSRENPYVDPMPEIVKEIIHTMGEDAGVSPLAAEKVESPAHSETGGEAQQAPPSAEALYDVRPGEACVEMIELPDGTKAVSRLVLGLPPGEVKRADLLGYPAFLALELALRDAEVWAESRMGRLLSVFGVKTDEQAKRLGAVHGNLIFASWLASKDESPYVEVKDPAKAQLLYDAIRHGIELFIDFNVLHGGDPRELRNMLGSFLKHVPAAESEG
jgi:hypothetical protein